MAEDKNIVFDLKVKGVEQSIESMKDLKNAIKSAKDEQLKAASTFGESSKQYTDASKKVSALTDKVDDLKDSTTSLAGTGLERAKAGISQFGEGLMNLDFGKIKAGLTALKSALASTGIMLIVMAVSYLIANFEELSKGTGLLGVVLRSVGAYIQVFIDALTYLTDALGLTNSALDAQREAMVANAEAAKEALGEQTKEYDRQMAVAKSNGESTVKIELQKQRAIQATNAMILRQLLAQIKAGQELDESQKKLLTSTLESVKNTHTAIQVIENTDRKDRAEKDKKAYEDRQANNEKIQNANLSALQQLEDATIANENDAELKATLTANKEKERRDAKIKDDITGQAYKDALLFQSELTLANQLQAISDKAAADDKKLDNADALTRANLRVERNQDDISAKINLLEVQKSIELQNKELTTKEIELIEQKHLTNIENLKKAANAKILADKNKDDIAKAELNLLNNKNSVDAQIALLTTKKDIELQNTELTESQIALIKAKYVEQTESLQKAEHAKTTQQNLDTTKNALEGAQSLSDAFFSFKMAKVKKGSAEEEALAKKQFEINKALQLGTAIINGVQGVLAITAVPDFTLGVATAIRIGAQIALTAASVAKIATTKFGSSSGGGTPPSASAPPSVPIPSPPTLNTPGANSNSGTTFDETGKNTSGTSTITLRASIGVDEITAKTNRVGVLEKQATF